jgi:hypothetical protein
MEPFHNRQRDLILGGKRTETNAPQTKSTEGYSLLYITLKEGCD